MKNNKIKLVLPDGTIQYISQTMYEKLLGIKNTPSRAKAQKVETMITHKYVCETCGNIEEIEVPSTVVTFNPDVKQSFTLKLACCEMCRVKLAEINNIGDGQCVIAHLLRRIQDLSSKAHRSESVSSMNEILED